jgi:hypothetical protein
MPGMKNITGGIGAGFMTQYGGAGFLNNNNNPKRLSNNGPVVG